MSVLIVIPARYASTRFPGKPLHKLVGASGQALTLIERSWRAAQEVTGADRVVVATDDETIRKVAEGFKAEVVMTPSTCANGTERCAAALETLGEGFDIVVNLQGDAPLTPPWFVQALIEEMQEHPDVAVATPVLLTTPEAREALLEDRRAGRVGGTTAVFGRKNDALYFSKEVLPYAGSGADVYHHVGVYAYRPGALRAYRSTTPGRLEQAEGLEQLRFMEHNCPVRCVIVEDRGRPFWELNNPEDSPRIEAMLREIGLP